MMRTRPMDSRRMTFLDCLPKNLEKRPSGECCDIRGEISKNQAGIQRTALDGGKSRRARYFSPALWAGVAVAGDFHEGYGDGLGRNVLSGSLHRWSLSCFYHIA